MFNLINILVKLLLTNMKKKKIKFIDSKSPKKSEKRRSLIHYKTFNTNTKTDEMLSNNLEIIKEILDKEPQNRVNEEVKKVLPYIKKIPYFYEFLLLKEENDKELESLLIEFTWILVRKTYEKNLIIQKTKEESDIFYLILSGSVAVLDLILTKECMTEEEYVTFLVKMYNIKEYEIIKLCLKYNKNILDVDNENIEKFCNSGYKFKYKELKIKAMRDLYKNNFDIYHYKNNVPSLDDYFNITKMETQVKKQSDDKNIIKKYFYIPHYEKVAILEKGRHINNLIKNINLNFKDRYTYLTLENTEIGIIQKQNYDRPKLFIPIYIKKEKLISSIIKNFFIFKDVDSNLFAEKYSKYFIYKKYIKGEKIISQNSIYDGVYLLLNGNCEVSMERTLEELNGLMISFQYSLECFNEYLSNLKREEIEKGKKEDFIRNPIYQSEEYVNTSKGIKHIEMINLSPNEVIGTHEYYNYKNEFHHYSVEVINAQVTVIFIPKIIFHEIVSDDIKIKDEIIKKVELRAKLFIGKIKHFKEELIKDIKWKIFNRENLEKNRTISNQISRRNVLMNLKLNNNNKYFSTINSTGNSFNNTSINFNHNNSSPKIKLNKLLIKEDKLNYSKSPNIRNIVNKSININNMYSSNPSSTYFSLGSNIFRNSHHKFKSVNLKNRYNPINISSKTFFSGFPFCVGKNKEEEENYDNSYLPIINNPSSKYSTLKTFSI